MAGGVLLIVVIFAIGIVLILKRLDHPAEPDVIGRFGSLKLTRTELIDGNGRRYPLAGMTARVEDAEHRRELFLMIEGPAMTLLHSSPIKRGNGFSARAFAQQINLAGRQQQP